MSSTSSKNLEEFAKMIEETIKEQSEHLQVLEQEIKDYNILSEDHREAWTSLEEMEKILACYEGTEQGWRLFTQNLRRIDDHYVHCLEGEDKSKLIDDMNQILPDEDDISATESFSTLDYYVAKFRIQVARLKEQKELTYKLSNLTRLHEEMMKEVATTEAPEETSDSTNPAPTKRVRTE